MVHKVFSIRARLTVWFLGILAVLLLFLNLFLFLTLQHFLTEDLVTSLRTRARAVNGLIVAVPPGESPIKRMQEIINAPGSPAVQVQVFDLNGNVIVASKGAPEGLPLPDEQTRRLASFPDRQQAEIQRWQAPWGEQHLILWQIVRPRRGVPVILQLSISADRVDSTLSQLAMVMLLGDVATLLIGGLIGLPWVGRALHPLRQMAEATRRIAAGDLSQRLQAPSTRDEIGQLATSFNEMVEQLHSSFEAQRRFIADASHELRSPLTALRGSTEVLMMGAASDPRVTHQMLRSMNREIDRLIRLVGDLLTLSKFDAEMPSCRETVNLSKLLSETLADLKPLAEPRQLTGDIPPEMVISGDGDRLKQVFFNVAENAIRHTTPDGRIDVTLRKDDRWVSVLISDNGEGIPPEDQPHVFQRFYSSNRSRSRRKSGTGLGLAIVKAIVEAHGGTIGLTSRPGEGSVFEICLPLS